MLTFLASLVSFLVILFFPENLVCAFGENLPRYKLAFVRFDDRSHQTLEGVC
jgi:hypothetical protein